MNPRQLECFIAAVRTGSVSRAAEELFLTQPTVTYQLKSLEEEVGFTLLERGPRGVAPTEIGQRLVPMAERVTADIAAIDELFAGLRRKAPKPITVLHCQIIHDRLWRPLLAEYAALHPEVQVRTVFGSFSDELAWPNADVYIVPQKSAPEFWPPTSQRELLYRAWVHGIMVASHPLASRDFIDLGAMRPYPLLFPSAAFMKTLGCWYWKTLNQTPGEFQLEFHEARSLHEIQLQLFSNRGIFISQGEHTDIAPGIVEVPFTPESQRVEEMVCWNEEPCDPAIEEFVAFARRYYSLHSQTFEVGGAGYGGAPAIPPAPFVPR